MLKQYRVSLVTSSELTYTVDAHTPEEAEVIVEGWFRDGERGTTEHEEIESSEAVPLEEFGSDLVEGIL